MRTVRWLPVEDPESRETVMLPFIEFRFPLGAVGWDAESYGTFRGRPLDEAANG